MRNARWTWAAGRGPFRPIHRFFGADEPNYAYLPDGLALLREIGQLGPAQAYFRAHSLMVTGDGTPALKWRRPRRTRPSSSP